MSIVLPRITWGFEVGPTNYLIPIDRGGSDFNASIPYGVYGSPVELAAAAEDAMNDADPGQTYTCAWDSTTRTFTFDNGATAIKLEWTRNGGANAHGLFGFAATDTASTAAGLTSTSAVKDAVALTGNSTAYTWAPVEPIALITPVTAAADGTTAALLQRIAKTSQFRSDGGRYESIHHSTDKILRFQFKWLAGTERNAMELFLDWALKGKRFLFQPDKTSANALRLMMFNPGEVASSFSWLTRPEMDFPEMAFVEALTRS